MGCLKKIDRVLTESVGNFDIFTAGVDYITINCAKSKGAKRATQGLTYFSRPIDLAIQLVASPIFALYQTGKDIYTTFKDKGIGWGIASVAVSPLNFAWKLISNIFSTNFISTPINTALFAGTIVDILSEDSRAQTRAAEMNIMYKLFENNFALWGNGEKLNWLKNKIVGLRSDARDSLNKQIGAIESAYSQNMNFPSKFRGSMEIRFPAFKKSSQFVQAGVWWDKWAIWFPKEMGSQLSRNVVRRLG